MRFPWKRRDLLVDRIGEGLLSGSARAGWILFTAVVAVGAGYVLGRRSGDSNGSVWSASADRATTGRAESPPLTPEQQRAAFIPVWDALKRRVQAEAPDPNWSPETEASIERVVAAQLAPEVKVSEVRCGSSLCRAKLTHPASPRIPYAKFVRFTLNRESLGEMEIQLDTRDEGVTTLYFLRNKPRSPPR